MIGEKSRERTEGKRGERNLARPLIRNLIRIRVRSHEPVHRFIAMLFYSNYCFVPGLFGEREREIRINVIE